MKPIRRNAWNIEARREKGYRALLSGSVGHGPSQSGKPRRLRVVILSVLMAAFFPRFALFLVWVLRPGRVDAAFDTFILPLIGITFLPFATLMYVLLYTPGVGLSGWEWFWVAVCAFFDVGHIGIGYLQQTQSSPSRPVTPAPSRMA